MPEISKSTIQEKLQAAFRDYESELRIHKDNANQQTQCGGRWSLSHYSRNIAIKYTLLEDKESAMEWFHKASQYTMRNYENKLQLGAKAYEEFCGSGISFTSADNSINAMLLSITARDRSAVTTIASSTGIDKLDNEFDRLLTTKPQINLAYALRDFILGDFDKARKQLGTPKVTKRMPEIGLESFLLMSIIDNDNTSFLDYLNLLLKTHHGQATHGGLREQTEGLVCISAVALTILALDHGLDFKVPKSSYLPSLLLSTELV